MNHAIIPFSLWHLIVQSDGATLAILGVLFVISVVNWAVFVAKVIRLYTHRKMCAEALSKIETLVTLEQLMIVAESFKDTAPGYLFDRQLVCSGINDLDMMMLQTESTIDEVIDQEQRWLALFSTSAAVAPLLGLFGTVWGLMHAFMGIAHTQSADITAVAPGIAEALTTTLAGLLVAIPALAMGSCLHTLIGSIESLLTLCSQRVLYIKRLCH
jgi:biopolymer transport protein ExbB/TolQ